MSCDLLSAKSPSLPRLQSETNVNKQRRQRDFANFPVPQRWLFVYTVQSVRGSLSYVQSYMGGRLHTYTYCSELDWMEIAGGVGACGIAFIPHIPGTCWPVAQCAVHATQGLNPTHGRDAVKNKNIFPLRKFVLVSHMTVCCVSVLWIYFMRKMCLPRSVLIK